MDLVYEIEKDIQSGDYDCYYDEKVMIEGIHSLKKIDKEKLKMISEASKIIQEDNKTQTSITDRKINRLGVILAGSIILDKFYDYIKDVSKEEFIILSYFCSSQDLNDFEQDIKIINQNILYAICNKYDNYYDRERLMTVVYNEIKKNNLNDNEEVISYIKAVSEEELNNRYFEYINEGAVKATNQIS